MELIILIIVVAILAVILFFAFGGILFWITKLFKLENSSYKKSLIILILSGLVSGVIRLVFGVVNLGILSSILATIGSFLVFHYFLKKYYQNSWKKSLGIYVVFGIISVIASLIIVVSIRLFVAEPFVVSGKAMSPTYNSGDYLFINKLSKSFNRGDVVIVRLQQQNIFVIKRIIGLPTEKVEIKNGEVIINGQVLSETYYNGSTLGDTSVTLSQDQFFVLGDNRNESYDSRNFGPVSLSGITGKVFFEVPGLLK